MKKVILIFYLLVFVLQFGFSENPAELKLKNYEPNILVGDSIEVIISLNNSSFNLKDLQFVLHQKNVKPEIKQEIKLSKNINANDTTYWLHLNKLYGFNKEDEKIEVNLVVTEPFKATLTSFNLFFNPIIVRTANGESIFKKPNGQNPKSKFLIENNHYIEFVNKNISSAISTIYLGNVPYYNIDKINSNKLVALYEDIRTQIANDFGRFNNSKDLMLGFGDDEQLHSTLNTVSVVTDSGYNYRKIVGLIAGFVLILLILILSFLDDRKFGLWLDMLKDEISQKKEESIGDYKERLKERPYSLARTQFLYWTLIVLLAFFVIWVRTGDTLVITTEILALLGISAGTYGGAKLIDKNDIQLKKSRHQDDNDSKKFIIDILSDKNGISVHRFQNVVFSISIGIYVIYEIFYSNVIPNLDNNLLILMGLSSVTYVGLKVTENKSNKNEDSVAGKAQGTTSENKVEVEPVG